MTEQWRPIARLNGLYSVSDQGRIRSEPRKFTRSNGHTFTVRGRILKVQVNKSKYPHVMIAGKPYKIHIVVAEAFIGPRPPGLVVMHGNDIATDNRLENLSYGTPAQNMATVAARRTSCPHGHDYTPENTYIYKNARFCRTCARATQVELRRRRRIEQVA